MEASIRELRTAGIDPEIWKIEGMANQTAFEHVVKAATEDRPHTGVVVLGRAESKVVVNEWLRVAGKIPGVVGFAVGRTIFAEPLTFLHQGKLSREEAIAAMATDFAAFIDVFEGRE
jgi:5-dehydro-2-deoxygluconokinase